MPQISIIVPVYKAEQTLRRCVDSILAQTFTDFECLLVEDGSPDGCPEICEQYAQMDSRVRVLHQKNAGVSTARNNGIEAAGGAYLMFCDSDDYVHPRWCEMMHHTIQAYPNAWVVCNVQRTNGGGYTVS